MNTLRGLVTVLLWLHVGVAASQEQMFVPLEVADVASATDLEVLKTASWQLNRQQQPDSSTWWLDQLALRLDTTQANVINGRYLFARGKTSFYQQNLRAARDYFKAACTVFERVGDEQDRFYAESYRQLAEMGKYIHADFTQVVADYRNSIRLFEFQRDTFSYLSAVQNLAQFYGTNQFYELARTEREVVFHYAEELQLHEMLVVANLVAAIEYELQGQDRPMLAHLRKAEEAFVPISDLVYLNYFINRFNLAHYYFAEERVCANYYFAKLEEAMVALKNNERFRDHFERDSGIWHYLNGRYAKAEAFAIRALKKSIDRGEQNNIVIVLELLKKISAGQGDYEAAYHYTERELKLRDSLQNEVRLTQSTYYEDLYEQEKEASRQERQREALRVIDLQNQERVRQYVLLGIIVTLLLISAFLYRSFRHQREKESLQKQFSRDLLLGRTEERKHIAMDLHDHIIHDLSFVKNTLLESGQPGSEESEVYQNFDQVLTDLRGISLQLYDPSPELLGFNLALNELVNRFNQNESTFFHVNLPAEEITLPAAVAGQLFAIVQEALRNVIRHARAKAARVDVTRVDGTVRISIRDNGIGFTVASGRGIGLRSMRERAAIINADLEIDSTAGQGTLITLTYNSNA